MEEEFLNLGLDIIGLGVFNHDFGSISRESPVIKARCLLYKQQTSSPHFMTRSNLLFTHNSSTSSDCQRSIRT